MLKENKFMASYKIRIKNHIWVDTFAKLYFRNFKVVNVINQVKTQEIIKIL